MFSGTHEQKLPFAVTPQETHALITPNFPCGSSHEIAGDYAQKWMLRHHFSHYYNRKCQQMVLVVTGVINPSPWDVTWACDLGMTMGEL